MQPPRAFLPALLTAAVLSTRERQGGSLGPGVGGAAGGAGGAGGDDGAGAKGGATSSSSGATSTASATSSSGSPSTTSSSGSTSSSSSSSSSGTAPCDFTASAACPAATVLQTIAGDEDHDVRTAAGSTSRWFKVMVEEAVSSPLSFPDLSYTVTLDSPPGTTYGLFVYTGNDSTAPCSGAAKQGTGEPAKVSDDWSDSLGSDDSTWITIEVRYLSGTACGPSDQWTLTVEGHT